MKFFRLDLLTLLISLFIFNSCKNENTVGLAAGTQAISGTIVDTASVYTNTLPEDTIETHLITKLPLGFLNDPVFGTTESDIIFDLNLPGNNNSSGNIEYTRPTGAVTIDSAVLVLKYADGFYGDSTSNYTVNVYQLGERVITGTDYYDNKKWKYNQGNVLGTLTFQPRPLDSVKIDTMIDSKDSSKKIAPQIRIPISHNFIDQNLFGASIAELNSNLIFKNTVNGFFISVAQNSISGVGGTLMIKAPGDSALQVYCRITNGTVVDTTIVYLPVANHATQINHVYSTQVQNSLNLTAQNTANHTNIPDNYIYLQGNGGLRTKITFPYLSKLFSTIPGGINNVVINRAELVVTSAAGNIPGYLVPLPKITLYRYDITNQPFTIQDATTAIGGLNLVDGFGGFYSKTTLNYHFLVTTYIQSILNGTNIDYGTYIAPIDTTNTSSVSIDPTVQTSARTIAFGYNTTFPYHLKLNIIYTKTRP